MILSLVRRLTDFAKLKKLFVSPVTILDEPEKVKNSYVMLYHKLVKNTPRPQKSCWDWYMYLE
jgi:hypothetical protein